MFQSEGVLFLRSDGTTGAVISLATTTDGGSGNIVLDPVGSGAVRILGGLRPTSVISPAQITSDTDNYAPTDGLASFMWRISSDAARNLTGISIAQVHGDMKMLANIGAFTITLVHDATSTAANRFYGPNSADVALRANGFVWIIYDGTSSRWRVMGA